MTKGLKAILKSIINDMASSDRAAYSRAEATMNDSRTVDLLLEAGCPVTIINALNDTLPLSQIERDYCCNKILERIKKIPTLGRD